MAIEEKEKRKPRSYSLTVRMHEQVRKEALMRSFETDENITASQVVQDILQEWFDRRKEQAKDKRSEIREMGRAGQ